MSLYVVKVVNMSGTILATFDTGSGADPRQTVTVEEVAWQLNEPGSATITVPLDHPEAGAFVALTREVQVFRSGTLIFWGVLVQRELGDGYVTWTCPGLLWYLTRRYFGPISINLLTNPRFATNLSGWSAVGATATHSTAVRLRGPGSAKLVAAASGDNYLSQTITVTTSALQGLGLTAAALFYIEAMDEPAAEEAGIWIQSANAFAGPDPLWEPLTMNEGGQQKIQRVEISTDILANVTNDPVEIRLYAPKGTTYWGATSVTIPESISSTGGVPAEVAQVVNEIIDYAQTGAGKSTLNFLKNIPNTGVVEFATYQFTDLAQIFSVLQAYPGRGIFDFDVVLTNTTRTFTTYAPRKGSLKNGNALTVPGNGVIKLGHRLDGQQTATHVTRRGEGSGSDRELGVAIDTSGLGGLVLQDIGDALPEALVDSLDAYATTELARLKNTVALPDITVAAAGWIGSVVVGDTVPVTINWGAVQDSATKRVVSMTLDCVADLVDVGFMVA